MKRYLRRFAIAYALAVLIIGGCLGLITAAIWLIVIASKHLSWPWAGLAAFLAFLAFMAHNVAVDDKAWHDNDKPRL